MTDYTRKGNEIYSAKGKLVATLTDTGAIQMAPGMAGPHSKGVREFISSSTFKVQSSTAEPAAKPETAPPNTFVGEVPLPPPLPAPEPASPGPEPDSADYLIASIPEDQLPPFTAQYGTRTPGFADWIRKHRFTPEQTAALVARLTRRKTV